MKKLPETQIPSGLKLSLLVLHLRRFLLTRLVEPCGNKLVGGEGDGARGVSHMVTQYNEERVFCQQFLEPLREYFNTPIIISSGYRCPALNKAVGGVSNSQHMTGEACDIHLSDMKKLRSWFAWLMDNVNADQLILERASKTSSHYWLHVSCKSDLSKNRHQVLYLTKN